MRKNPIIMYSNIKFSSLFILAVVLFFSGCAQDGEQGPQGAKGDKGDQGEQGEQGDQGEPGTANVKYSDWMDISWDNDGTTIKEMYIEEPLVTQDFINTGTVLVYIKSSVAEAAIALPLINGNDNLHYASINKPEVLVGILLSVDSMDGTTPVNSYSSNKIRYVLIPGGVALSEGRAANPDLSDYESVKTYYHIPD